MPAIGTRRLRMSSGMTCLPPQLEPNPFQHSCPRARRWRCSRRSDDLRNREAALLNYRIHGRICLNDIRDLPARTGREAAPERADNVDSEKLCDLTRPALQRNVTCCTRPRLVGQARHRAQRFFAKTGGHAAARNSFALVTGLSCPSHTRGKHPRPYGSFHPPGPNSRRRTGRTRPRTSRR